MLFIQGKEAKAVEDETRARELLLVLEEKQTAVIKLEESLKLRGVELPKEAPKEAPKEVVKKDDGGKTVSWKSKVVKKVKGK